MSIFKQYASEIKRFFENELEDNDPFWATIAGASIAEYASKTRDEAEKQHHQNLQEYIELFVDYPVTRQSERLLLELICLTISTETLKVIDSNQRILKNRISPFLLMNLKAQINSREFPERIKKEINETYQKIKGWGNPTFIEIDESLIDDKTSAFQACNIYYRLLNPNAISLGITTVAMLESQPEMAEEFMRWMLNATPKLEGYKKVIKNLQKYKELYIEGVKKTRKLEGDALTAYLKRELNITEGEYWDTLYKKIVTESVEKAKAEAPLKVETAQVIAMPKPQTAVMKQATASTELSILKDSKITDEVKINNVINMLNSQPGNASGRNLFFEWLFNGCCLDDCKNAFWKMLIEPALKDLGLSALTHLHKYPERLIKLATWMIDSKRTTANLDIVKLDKADSRTTTIKYSLSMLYWASEQYRFEKNMNTMRDASIGKVLTLPIEEMIIQVRAATRAGIPRSDIACILAEHYLTDMKVRYSELKRLNGACSLNLGTYFATTGWADNMTDSYQRLRAAIALGESTQDILSLRRNSNVKLTGKFLRLLKVENAPKDKRSSACKMMDYMFEEPLSDEPFNNIKVSSSSFLIDKKLTTDEKAKRLIYLMLNGPRSLFYQIRKVTSTLETSTSSNVWCDESMLPHFSFDNYHPDFWNHSVLAVLCQSDKKVREKIIESLSDDTSKVIVQRRIQFIKWFFEKGSLVASAYGRLPAWARAAWEMLRSNKPFLQVHMLEQLVREPKRIKDFIEVIMMMPELDMAGFVGEMQTMLSECNHKEWPVEAAKQAVRTIKWAGHQIKYDSNASESNRNDCIQAVWALEADEIVAEVTAMKANEIRDIEITALLFSRYVDDRENDFQKIKKVQQRTKLPFAPIFAGVFWNSQCRLDALEETFELDAELDDIVSIKTNRHIPLKTFNELVKLVVKYNKWSTATPEAQLGLLQYIPAGKLAEHKKELPISEAFIKACRNNPIGYFEFVIVHAAVMEEVFIKDADAVKVLLLDAENDIDSVNRVLKVFSNALFPAWSIVGYYPFLDERLKAVLVDKKSYGYEARISKFDDEFFESYGKKSKTKKALPDEEILAEQNAFLNMCWESNMWKDMVTRPNVNVILKAGLDRKIFDVEMVKEASKKNKVILAHCEAILNPPKPVQKNDEAEKAKAEEIARKAAEAEKAKAEDAAMKAQAARKLADEQRERAAAEKARAIESAKQKKAKAAAEREKQLEKSKAEKLLKKNPPQKVTDQPTSATSSLVQFAVIDYKPRLWDVNKNILPEPNLWYQELEEYVERNIIDRDAFAESIVEHVSPSDEQIRYIPVNWMWECSKERLAAAETDDGLAVLEEKFGTLIDETHTKKKFD